MSRVKRRRRRLAMLSIGILAALLLAGGWVARQALGVRDDLTTARAELAAFSSDLTDPAGARSTVDSVRDATASARARSSGVAWRAAEMMPVIGDDLGAIRTAAESVDSVARDVLGPLAGVGRSLEDVRRPDGSVDVTAVAAASPALQEAARSAAAAQERFREIERSGLLPPVARAVSELTGRLDELAEITATAARAARLAPPMLGAEDDRRYLLAFQNPAEARATGGLVGVYAVLEARDGRLSLREIGTNGDLTVLDAPLDLGPDYRGLYRTLPTVSANVNLSPHFSYAARNLLEIWRAGSGERLDGVIALDPVALSHLLRATPPAALPSGESVDADSVVDQTLSEAYVRFPDDDDARQEFLTDVVAAVFPLISGGEADTHTLLKGLRASVDERRLLLFSADDGEQRELAQTALSGGLPPADGRARGVFVNDASASKLGYYLERSLRYEPGCPVDGRTESILRMTVHNAAPPTGLPVYVTSHIPELAPSPATQRLIVSAFLPASTGLRSYAVDGLSSAVATGRERGYEVFVSTVDVPPGGRVELTWQLDEPAAADHVALLEQPLVRPMEMHVAPSCSDAE